MSTAAEIRAATLAAHRQVIALDRAALDDLIRIYTDAANEIAGRISRIGGNVNFSQLADLREQIKTILEGLQRQRNVLLNQNVGRAADLGVVPFDDLALAQNITVPVRIATSRVSQDAVRFVRNFIARDGLQLSDRIFRIDRAARDSIINTLERAVVQGQGAAQAARELLARGEPVSAQVASKIDEANSARLSTQVKQILAGEKSPMNDALRLMRTEINRAHGEAYMMSGGDHPDFAGWKYLLSPAHPKPDICDLLSSQNLHGLGDGVYPSRDETPWPAHPNTLSFIAIVFKDEVSDADRAGKQSEREALDDLSADQRIGVLGKKNADLFDQGKFRKDYIPEVA